MTHFEMLSFCSGGNLEQIPALTPAKKEEDEEDVSFDIQFLLVNTPVNETSYYTTDQIMQKLIFKRLLRK